jgi:hypothetical protein
MRSSPSSAVWKLMYASRAERPDALVRLADPRRVALGLGPARRPLAQRAEPRLARGATTPRQTRLLGR